MSNFGQHLVGAPIQALMHAPKTAPIVLAYSQSTFKNELAISSAEKSPTQPAIGVSTATSPQSLIAMPRRLYVNEPFEVELSETVYALDATTIDLCLSVFPWAPFRSTKAAIKLHTLLDLRGNIPSFIRISDGKWHEINMFDELITEPGAFYVMDRGYIDFERLGRLNETDSFFLYRNFKPPFFSGPSHIAGPVGCQSSSV
jgi:Transposase DDE domain